MKTKTHTKSRPSGSTTKGGAAPKPGPIPKLIYAQASPKSIGGSSLFDAGGLLSGENVENYRSEPEIISRAVHRLRDAGFDILQVNPYTINIAGNKETYERAFATRIMADERPVIKEGAVEDTATFLDCPDTDLSGLIGTQGCTLGDVIEGVALEEPRYYMAASSFAPTKSYWHLDVPAGVSLGCNADRAHRAGFTGKSVRVAMVDSGWFKHPFFVDRGYRAQPVVLGPGAANPLDDESGHGTGESANIFAVAPDAILLPVKMSFVNTTASFQAAVALNPHIITNSWGSSTNGPLSAANQALAAAIAAAVRSGIIVIFSAGNGHAGFPGQHPDVISAGGVYMDGQGNMRASNYASGFLSRIYPNRRVPDLSGLVGMAPGASYIMLPVQPGDEIDVGKSGGTHPPQDETPSNDGWAAFSGTSAAAPQLAGAAALVRQACPRLTPAQVRRILMDTARDVTVGNCSAVPGTGLPPGQGHPAGPGPDLATGTGLVNAHKAAMIARLQCLGPILPPGPPVPVLPPPVLPPVFPPPVMPPPPLPLPPLPPLPVPPIPPVPPLSAEEVDSLSEFVVNS